MKNYVYIYIILLLLACKPGPKVADNNKNTIEISEKQPSDVIPFLDKWKILLGDGTPKNDLIGYKKDDFFYVVNKDSVNWVVFKTPNAGITSKTSKNTRTELHQKKYWTPKQGGKLSATLKVQHVSTTGDADKASSFSVVIGQIHSDDGHKNEPLKIYYKKFPGHQKGSVFFNYEINTKGDNAGRWDMSTPVWGHSFFKVGKHATDLPEDPKKWHRPWRNI
jgi:Alginate lyase.